MYFLRVLRVSVVRKDCLRYVFLFLFLGCLPGLVGATERRTPVVDAVAKAGPAVVNIRTEQIVERRSPFFGFSDPFFEEFFRDLTPPRTFKTQSLGSGVFIDPRGYILTNAHVIAKASKIFVALPDRPRELEATLVGKDERIDLAVLRVEGKEPFPALKPGRSDDLLLGETVIAIGNPLGLGHSITTGIVSAPRRRVPTGGGAYSVFIQTDALINPGNSGGPLININGDLIGINTAIARQAQGIGFAVPIDAAKRVLKDLMEFGRVRQAFLGIHPAPVGEAFLRSRGTGGVLVSGVEAGSPAERAGVRTADVILSLDDVTVSDPEEFLSLLHTYTPGDPLRVGLLRGMDNRETTVKLTAIPVGYGLKYGERTFGLAVADGKEGLTVKGVLKDSPAERAGIRRGDLVAEVAGERISNSEDFSRIIEGLIGREPIRFLIARGGRGYYVDLP